MFITSPFPARSAGALAGAGEGKSQLTSYFYDYMCASDTYINKLADKDGWFTFRSGDGSQYRVEIEMRMKEKVSRGAAQKSGSGWILVL